MAAPPEILVIEDNEDDIAVARRAFQRHRIAERVGFSRDGREALETLAEGPVPRVILLDLKMDGLSGTDVLRRLRSADRTRSVPIVVVSASRRKEDIDECYRLGANSYVTKQYGAHPAGDYLVDVVEYWLNLNQVADGT